MQFARGKRQSGVLFDMRLAIVVPYRDRAEHLETFVPYMETYLKLQGIQDFKILIVEQADNKPFNRGKLLNVGYNSIDADYYVFHDIDMLPITADYSGSLHPTHLVSSATQFKKGIPYETYFGGVTMFPSVDFLQINGFSNEFWNWGSEDDDLIMRCKTAGLEYTRRKGGKFKSLDHAINIDEKQAQRNFERYKENIHYTVDGLSTLDFNIVDSRVLTLNCSFVSVTL
mgnify:CR=1 FL=1